MSLSTDRPPLLFVLLSEAKQEKKKTLAKKQGVTVFTTKDFPPCFHTKDTEIIPKIIYKRHPHRLYYYVPIEDFKTTIYKERKDELRKIFRMLGANSFELSSTNDTTTAKERTGSIGASALPAFSSK
jgi:hypothetical protein